jgi:hypothetical protein
MQGLAHLSVLSVSEGDKLIKVNPEDPASRKHFAEIVTDLLRKGYLISVLTGHDDEGREIRAKVTEFDPNTLEYLVENTTPEEDEALQRRMNAGDKGGRRKAAAGSVYRWWGPLPMRSRRPPVAARRNCCGIRTIPEAPRARDSFSLAG